MWVDLSDEGFTQEGKVCSLGDREQMSIPSDKHRVEVNV